MEQKKIIIKREELYEQVWSEPMTTLAKEYNLSDVGLAKICKKLNVPKPFPGYWALKAAGKQISIPKLPTLNDGAFDTYELLIDENKIADQKIVAERIKKIDQSNLLENIDISFREKLTTSDRRILTTKEVLLQRKTPDHLIKRRNSIFDIVVTKQLLEKSLSIFDILIRALISINQNIIIDPNDFFTYAIINQQKIRIRLIEIRKLVKLPPHKLTPYLYPTQEYHYTGKLSLQIYDSYKFSKGNSYDITDTNKEVIKNRMKDFILKLFAVSIKKEFESEKRKEWNLKYEQEQKLLEEEELKEELEKKNFKNLLEDTSKWHQSQILNSYIEAVLSNFKSKNIDITENKEIQEWIIWAKEKAEALNPIK